MTLDLDRFQRQLQANEPDFDMPLAAVNHESSLLEETGDLAIGSGDHLADSATDTFMRELDEGLEGEHLLGRSRRRWDGSPTGPTAPVPYAVESSTRPGSSSPVRHPLR